MINKVNLQKEKETLLIPLLGKAGENEKKEPILIDKKAVEIVKQIDYDFDSLKIPEKTNIMMCIRAKLIDNFVKDFFAEGKEGVVLHLGCGLDSRYNRIENTNLDWYDVDFEDVINIRRYFYKETDNYHLLASSVTEPEWIGKIPGKSKEYLVIAEGLFMYLREHEIKELINRLQDRIGRYTLIFDAYNVLTAKNANNHPSLKKTGAKIHWGINNPEELMEWGAEIQFVDEKYFTTNEEIKNLTFGTRMMFKIANLFPVARKAHRLLIYKIG